MPTLLKAHERITGVAGKSAASIPGDQRMESRKGGTPDDQVKKIYARVN